MTEPLEQLSGTVDRLFFHNAENGFTVFVLQLDKKRETIVKGYLPNIQPGQHVRVSGTWITHPKFGRQFDAQQCHAQTPTSLIGLKKYLGSGLIKGIGPTYAEKLVNYFGQDVLTIIDQHPQRLHEVPGIGPKRVDTIITAWHDQKEISHVMVFLQDKGISPVYATKIYKKYGAESVAIITQNPYRLATDIWGIGFKMADQIAQNMGFAHDSVKRITAGLLHTISTIISNGHLYIELDALKTNSTTLLELDATDAAPKIKCALHDLYNEDKIKLITHNEQHFVTLSQYYFSEKGVSTKLKKLVEQLRLRTFDIDAIYTKLRTAQDIALNEDQQRGILTCLQNNVTVVTGGPGTGKTTLIKKLLSILDENKYSYKLAAPTGRAAKRITESTGKQAVTIHRLLEFDVSTMGFARNEQNALHVDFLIIDEASMIDIFLAFAILKAVPLNAHVVFIGDIDQLPSVGAGNFLKDIIASNIVPTIRLTEIFRQAQDSLIIINAHRINNGEFPVSQLPGARRDFLYIKENDPQNVQHHLENIYKQGLAKFNISPHNTTVLVPMNRGVVGTHTINFNLQQLLNPDEHKPQIAQAGTTFKLHDRVMQIRNNYDKLVFNGDIGTIEQIDVQEKQLTVRYPERSVVYEFSELDELVLAYAITIHKSQGSEYDAVIIPIFMQHFTLLQRNLLYTAITRAKKLCIFIGQPKAIGMAINNNTGLERTTFLPQFLTTDLQCR
ncbi:MAG TPA: ATP-dependent RecD-like DNA helicase [Candidatus Dependentiae bacterium]|mgnify:CR=1 FL=1|nr:ATP-dependent RecD-like DNA helicase [Candidatus Dependentiae bacterium]HRQ63179.1 ATP-dependent RecD-like DNA helicase [Candidatus Dependentiae bacterium]